MAKKKNSEERMKTEKEKQYEITMYKLLGLFAISLLITLGVGFYAGSVVGLSQGVDSVNIAAPDYCTINEDGTNVTVSCLEISNITAGDLCRMLSTPLENKIRVMIVP